MPVGEVFLSAFIQVVFQQLASGALQAFARWERVKCHFDQLRDSFSIIKTVLDDAEDKQLREERVKGWLEDLRDLAYDLDDLLDEINTLALIRESKGIQQHKSSIVRKLIPTCTTSTPDVQLFNYRMISKIEDITNRFNNITSKRKELNLREKTDGPSNRLSLMKLPSTSLVKESRVFGRVEDKESVIKMLLDDEAFNKDLGNKAHHDNFTVIPIVGMGGIGKTTLAQLVYNDINIRQNFHERAWVSVAEEFDVLTITKTIFRELNKSSDEPKDLNLLQVSIQKKLSERKFLIVLDNIWDVNYEEWNLLCLPFHFGLPSSRIIITTRNNGVSSVVGFPRTAYHVKLLIYGDCYSLLAQHAPRSFHESPELREVGVGLVKKCNGLPLAALTLGGLLCSKESKKEWEDVLNSKLWDFPKEYEILPILRLSYQHLPPHLKHLFAYCSIFPKEYEFDKNELISLWMGEGLLEQPSETKTKEELGLDYFNDLLSRSFFQQSSKSNSKFIMHGFLTDLAQYVARGTCYRLGEKMDHNQEYEISEKARHVSFPRHEYEYFQKFKAFHQVKGLRTFLPIPVQNPLVGPFYLSNRILFELVPKLHCLRVLSLRGYSITELPSSICNLIHLRYLNLSGTLIVSLPDSLSGLYHLETLSLRNCDFICKLPPTLGNLSNLRHLDNSDTDLLKELPVEIGKLESLQTLPKIVLSRVGGLGLRELKNLKLLRGVLAISELQTVTDIENAMEASMRDKELEELQLRWTNDINNSRDSFVEENVLAVLQPHENLKNLMIESYGGVRFPSWIGNPSFCKLFFVSLSGCDQCTSLPPLGQLPELKILHIKQMRQIKRIGVEFSGTSSMDVPFPKLETLTFDDMADWAEWTCSAEEFHIQFPRLNHLSIFKCPNLTTVSPLSLPVLNGLDLKECSVRVLYNLRDLDLLNVLKVKAVTGLAHLPRELVHSTTKLEGLQFYNCNELLSVWPNGFTPQHLSCLRRLVVADCSILVSLGEEEQQIPCNLESLKLFQCANLTSLPNELRNLGSLRELIIKNCPNIISFPEQSIPPMLKRLEILGCNAMHSLPTDISSLENLEIKECSSLRKWSAGNFPDSLIKLSIEKCNDLDPVSETMFPPNRRISLEDLSIWDWLNCNTLLPHVHNFPRLTELYLSHCDGLERFPDEGLPLNLRILCIIHCSNLRSLPLHIRNMLSLVSLEIRGCCRLNAFPGCDFPRNLSSLQIWDSHELKPLSQWGLSGLKSLRELTICGGFPELPLLGHDDGLFPSSLIKFSIQSFQRLTSLSKVLENLTSLQHLSVANCPRLNVLPSKNVLEKLWQLKISNCPRLKKQSLKEKYWNRIDGIPCVQIDGTYVSRQS
ncbi:hypothetical protein BUALT_Bualt19G0043300 [Buddleja alternifolia]|uniref:Disease resistance RPP13-like protein 1 n=1 Tax=Buddleja alternifolia TaxID=168488 RepID=A0AAV6W9B6_9LAMI|nr:hypothetical protein BUALT_Bualt19G0043300 [Buddleja alternifolia]